MCLPEHASMTAASAAQHSIAQRSKGQCSTVQSALLYADPHMPGCFTALAGNSHCLLGSICQQHTEQRPRSIRIAALLLSVALLPLPPLPPSACSMLSPDRVLLQSHFTLIKREEKASPSGVN